MEQTCEGKISVPNILERKPKSISCSTGPIANSAKEIVAMKAAFYDDNKMVDKNRRIENILHRSPLILPPEIGIVPSNAFATRANDQLKATKKQTKPNRSGIINTKYDCYLCDKR